MANSYTGEFAALATALCWTFTSTAFTIASRYVGAGVVNRTRLAIAVFYLLIAHFFIEGCFFPIHIELSRIGWLGLSGIIGLVLGDAFLFQSFVLIGTQLSMLIMSLVPIISALIAWIFLKEILKPIEIFAITLTISGIIIVLIQKQNFLSDISDHKKYLTALRQLKIGILCAIGGAFGQAIGLVVAKKGMGGLSGLSVTLIRVLTGAVVIWIWTLFSGNIKQTFQKLHNKKANLFIAGAAFGGPFLGIWMSMIAIKWTSIGIASTLMALPPIMLLPVAYWVFKEKVTFRAVIGTLIAVAGSAIIFLT
jgi:drug/metabolite transporter (DMT)-like permease